MAKKVPMKRRGSKKVFTGFMLPISLTKKIRALSRDSKRIAKREGTVPETQSDIAERALNAVLD